MKSSSSFCKKLLVVSAIFFVGHSLLLDIADPAEQRGIGGVAPSAVVQYRNSWAVVIGINRYTKAPRLNYAVNDANSVVAAVQKLGFPSDRILLLLDDEATKHRIEQLLYGTLRRTTPEDRVFVFFAGHGMTASLPRGGEEGFILPVDGDPDDLPLTAIAMEDVRKIARRIPAKHILFAVDACYSGFAISREVAPTTVDNVYLEAVTKEPAVQIITAGRKGEPVLEEEGHGLFTRRLLSGLTGLADTDQNGIITAQELATWLESRVVRDSQDRQHPQYSRLDGEGQFVFVVPGRERPVVGAVQDEREKAREEMRRLAEEAEQLKRERALFDEQRKLQEEMHRIEIAKLEAERAVLKAETERFAVERSRSEKSRSEIEQKRQAEEQAKTELAKLEAERVRLKAEEERVQMEKARTEQARLEAERKRREDEAKTPAPEVIAKLTFPPVSSRPPTAIPNVAELPKYKVGDSWTVRFNDGRTASRSVRAVERDQYVFEWGLDLLHYYDQNLMLRRQITPEDGKDVPSALLNQRILDFPLSLNKTWETRVLMGRASGLGESSGQWRIFMYRVVEVEPVQTPAGIFNAFKIQESSYAIECWSVAPISSGAIACSTVRSLSGDALRKFALARGNRTSLSTAARRYWWYAPEAKFLIKLSHVRGGSWSGKEPDYELVAFDLK